MRIFVAGATGVIGRHTVPLLLAAGHEVTGMTRSAERAAALEREGVRGCTVDVYDRGALMAAMQAARPEVVMHLLTDLSGSDFSGNARIRIEGTRNLVDAAKAAGARRIISESLAWVYAAAEGPATEDQPLDTAVDSPRRGMVEPVVALETQSAEMPECVILRYAALYGPDTFYARNGMTAKRAREGKLEATDAITSFVHLRDSGAATAAAITWPVGAYNIADDEPAASKEWAPVYCEAVGAPAPAVRDGRQPWERGASNAKARGEGWQLVYPSWRQGFRERLA